MKLFGNTKDPTVFVIGVFHGDEPQGETLICRYLEKRGLTNILFLPRLNSSSSRVNQNGVDLNRNYPTKNWELTAKNDYYGGDRPASEQETRFVIETVEKYKPEIILSIHAPYKVVNFDGYSEKHEKVLNEISKIMGYPLEPSIGYPTPGSFGTWAGVERGILTITLELDEEISVKELEEPVFKVFDLLEGL